MTAATASPPSHSPFAVFRSRNFTLMWTAQLVSTVGTALTSLAASLLVYRVTGSAASVSLMLIASAAPGLLVGLFAGAFVDKHDRRRTMMVCDLTRGLLVAAIPWLVTHNVSWLYVIVAASSAINQYFDPAHESLLPEVASDEDLAAANSLMAISSFGSTAIGFAASGLIAGTAGINWAFWLDALTFLFSALCISQVRVASFATDATSDAGNVVQSLRAGFRQLRDTPALRSLFLVSTPMLVAFGLQNSLLLPYASRVLNATEFQYGLQEGMTSVGFVAGSLLMAGIFNRMGEGRWIGLGLIGMAIVGTAYTFTGSIAVAILLLTLSGFLNAPAAIGRRLIVQRNTPREMRGRVNSSFFVSRDLLFLVGMATAALADIIDVRLVYRAGALLVLAAGIWTLLAPGLRQEVGAWRRAIQFLRRASQAPGLTGGRHAIASDLDQLIGCASFLAQLDAEERSGLLKVGRIYQAEPGAAVLRQGEAGDDAYFVLAGRLVVGHTTAEGDDRYLATLGPGDFFGEIGALSGGSRTANVVAEETAMLFQVPGAEMQALMQNPAVSALVTATMQQRLDRSHLGELPRISSYDQASLRQLRQAVAEPSPT